MKITNNNFLILETLIESFWENRGDDILITYRSGNFSNAEKTKDVYKRMLWDVYHYLFDSSFTCTVLYQSNQLNDGHIYTAIKRIFSNMGVNSIDKGDDNV